jgi:RimJ/RimL family protein N-acetyltransferase
LTEALRQLRVRTPRLELRLPAEQELVALAQVVRGGIHPPERMPFLFPWTDRAHEPEFVDEFVAHHLTRLRESSPDAWALNLVTFLDDRPIGSQSMRAERFAETRTADTGSWLGEPWQNLGLGTEMRAAVLELAFRGLGAETATSGSFEDNPQSARVSEKLGYRTVGEQTVAPRGTPIRAIDYVLERTEWRSPVPVELEGIEAARPWFGITAAG